MKEAIVKSTSLTPPWQFRKCKRGSLVSSLNTHRRGHGAIVYMRLRGRPSMSTAPRSLCVGSIEASANGRWKTAKAPKTIAKDILRSWLPVGLYSQYTLDPGLVAHLVAGEGASKRAEAVNMYVDAEAVRKLFKIA